MKSSDLHITAELIREVADGDPAAFTALFNAAVPLLKPGIMKLARSEEVFREIIQECFLKVWLHRDQLPEIDKPLNWIYRVAANECFTWLNKESLRQKQLQQYSKTDEPANSSHTDQLLGFKETRDIVRQAVAALPEKKKVIYLESRVNGLKTIEIAEKLKVSHSYVRNSISEALRFIRDYMQKTGHLTVVVILIHALR